MELAPLLLISALVAAGVAGAVARTWSLHSRLYSLEDRVAVVEGITQREVKVRAAQERWKRPAKDEERLVEALTTLPPPTPPRNWWDLPGVPRSVGEKR